MPKQQRPVLRGGRPRVIRSQHPIREHYLALDECCKFSHLDAAHPDREALREITHRAREALSGNDNSLAQQKSTWNFFQIWCEEREVAPTATLDTAVKYLDYEASEGRFAKTTSVNKVSNQRGSGLRRVRSGSSVLTVQLHCAGFQLQEHRQAHAASGGPSGLDQPRYPPSGSASCQISSKATSSARQCPCQPP